MASIRLFGRGKNVAATGGPAVGAALIADALEGLAAASMSTTWRCRHGAGTSIGEGAVDFAAGRSRSTVIRGKYEFEYVRSGATVYRARVLDIDAETSADADSDAQAGVDTSEEVAADEDAAAEGDEETAEAEDDEDENEEDDDADAEDDDVDADDGALAASDGQSVAAAAVTVWETFSEHDACGVHAYAEPAVLAAGVRAAGVVQAREAQEFDGVLLSAFSVTVKPKPGDPNRVLARLARQLRDHGANVVVVTAFADESQAGGGDGDGSQEQDGEGPRIVRLRIELPHWTPADDPTADHSVSVDLFEFDEPVSVQVPGETTRRTARSCADLALF